MPFYPNIETIHNVYLPVSPRVYADFYQQAGHPNLTFLGSRYFPTCHNQGSVKSSGMCKTQISHKKTLFTEGKIINDSETVGVSQRDPTRNHQ